MLFIGFLLIPLLSLTVILFFYLFYIFQKLYNHFYLISI